MTSFGLWTALLHHTLHFFSGFIPWPAGQLKASENSFIFDSEPITLNKNNSQYLTVIWYGTPLLPCSHDLWRDFRIFLYFVNWWNQREWPEVSKLSLGVNFASISTVWNIYEKGCKWHLITMNWSAQRFWALNLLTRERFWLLKVSCPGYSSVFTSMYGVLVCMVFSSYL